jgi:1,2-diacylglycerol 3-beta-glucosyltransferase
LTRMQDMEFVGFSALVQNSRNSLGSVGLGGNGQFTRLSALQGLCRDPWTTCLSEDLDLSMSLAEVGWQIRYCPKTFVAQQGLTRAWPLLRQRTRWIQGHYQCWRHLRSIWGSRRLPLRSRLDLSAYLMMILFIFVVSAGFIVSFLGWAGLIFPINNSLDAVTSPFLHNLIQLLVSTGPLAAFVVLYQLRSPRRLRWWELLIYAAAFTVFALIIWTLGDVWAIARILTRRGSWTKTPRVPAEIAVTMTVPRTFWEA